jgi:hypothetical protein
MPPITPPAIALMGVDDEESAGWEEGEGDDVGEEEGIEEGGTRVAGSIRPVSTPPNPRLYSWINVPTPSLIVCNSTTPAGNLTFGVAHPFVLLLLYPGNPCSQQNKPPLSNISQVPFAQRGCSTFASASSLQPCAPGGQHTTLN